VEEWKSGRVEEWKMTAGGKVKVEENADGTTLLDPLPAILGSVRP
jgi:hypothetical protein